MKGIIIISGGMDSVTLLHHLVNEGHEMRALSFNYGQKHVREIECAKENCEILKVPHEIVELPFIDKLFKSTLLGSGQEIPEGHYQAENMKLTVVPNRNMIMSAIAIGYGCSLEYDFLALGVHLGDHAIYPDCRKEYIDALRNAVELCDWNKFTILTPFQDLDKERILKVGLPLNVDYSKTWTCYKGLEKACGKCGSCQERLEAFKAIGQIDPLPYSN